MSKVVLANGVFDLLHYGHLLHLEAAKKMGDILWVSITDDQHVNKGPNRPIYPQEHRLALVKALRCVDKAIVVSSLIEAIDFVQPNILVKGIDYSEGTHAAHERYCFTRNIEIRYTRTAKYSASKFLEDAERRK